MHISKIVDYVKNEISFSEEFCEDNVLVTLRIEPILKIIENLEQSHKYILEYDKEIRNKDRQIDLMAEFMFKNVDIEEDICNSAYIECKQETSQDMICINCIKQYFERKVKND